MRHRHRHGAGLCLTLILVSLVRRGPSQQRRAGVCGSYYVELMRNGLAASH